MGKMACQISSLTIVYSTVYSGADQRKHQSLVTGEFPAQMASNAENVSILMTSSYNGNSYIFIIENALENILSTMAVISSRPQCVKQDVWRHMVSPGLRKVTPALRPLTCQTICVILYIRFLNWRIHDLCLPSLYIYQLPSDPIMFSEVAGVFHWTVITDLFSKPYKKYLKQK